MGLDRANVRRRVEAISPFVWPSAITLRISTSRALRSSGGPDLHALDLFFE